MDKLKFRRSGIQARVLALTMFLRWAHPWSSLPAICTR